MFGNANDSRLIAEKSRKYQNFYDLLTSIKLDINDCANFGLNETTYKVEQNYLEFVDIVNQQLLEDGYLINFNKDTNKLKIKWPKQ